MNPNPPHHQPPGHPVPPNGHAPVPGHGHGGPARLPPAPTHGSRDPQRGHPGHAPATRPHAQQIPSFGGAPLTARILLLLSAPLGLLLALPFVLTAIRESPVLFLIPVVFGLSSAGAIVLVILAERRSRAVRWSTLAFHVLALAHLVFVMVGAPDPGSPGPGILFQGLAALFSLAGLVLIATPESGRYYVKPTGQPPAPPAGGRGGAPRAVTGGGPQQPPAGPHGRPPTGVRDPHR